MIFRNAVTGLLILAAAFIGCSKKTVYPDNPASATGITDAQGIAAVEVGPFKIDIKVVDANNTPLAGMNARAYLLKKHLMATAASPGGTYYNGITLVTYEDAQSHRKPAIYMAPSDANSVQSTASRSIDITVVLTSSGLASYGFDTTVPNMEALETDEWITPVADNYYMSSFYTLADSVNYSGGTIVHLTSDVSYSIGAGRQTASFLMDKISDVPTFASLISLELRVFDGDTIHTRKLNYQDSPLPVLIIDDIGMNRNFWMQFTLTWAQNPSDLDSHLFTPQIEGMGYHIYYASRGNSASAPYADLDVDDVTSYGPEHITIYTEYPGTYIYAVYHYSGSGTVSTSEAEVGILSPDGAVQMFNVPTTTASANWWWHVCSIDGTTGAVTPINVISADPPSPILMPPMPPKAEID